MALSVKVFGAYVEVVDDNKSVFQIGPNITSEPNRVSAATEAIYDRTFSVADATAQKVFDIATDLGDFDLMVIVSTVTGSVQFANNTAANFFTLQLLADIPFVIHGDNSLDSSGTVGAFDGNSDPIERVYVYNDSGATGQFRCWAIT